MQRGSCCCGDADAPPAPKPKDATVPPHRSSTTSSQFIPKWLLRDKRLPKVKDSTCAAAARGADRIAYILPLHCYTSTVCSWEKGAPRTHLTLSSLTGPSMAQEEESHIGTITDCSGLGGCFVSPRRSVQVTAVQETYTHLTSAARGPSS